MAPLCWHLCLLLNLPCCCGPSLPRKLGLLAILPVAQEAQEALKATPLYQGKKWLEKTVVLVSNLNEAVAKAEAANLSRSLKSAYQTSLKSNLSELSKLRSRIESAMAGNAQERAAHEILNQPD
eukprot:5334828-Alexandrium_andersonii.AAC.1